jgi:hypothetical protein
LARSTISARVFSPLFNMGLDWNMNRQCYDVQLLEG